MRRLASASSGMQLRHAAALINTEGGGAKARAVLQELLKTSPSDARVLYMLSTAERSAGDDKAAEATARKIIAADPANVAGLRALVAVLFDRFDYKQIVELVTPLAKEPSRARGREVEGAALLVHSASRTAACAVGCFDRGVHDGQGADAG